MLYRPDSFLGDDVHDLPSSRIDYQDFVVP